MTLPLLPYTVRIEPGAITKEYHANPTQVVHELNRLRATEITSFLQCKPHVSIAMSLLAPGLKHDFEAHAALELQHAGQLAGRIQQLGSGPVFSPWTSPANSSLCRREAGSVASL